MPSKCITVCTVSQKRILHGFVMIPHSKWAELNPIQTWLPKILFLIVFPLSQEFQKIITLESKWCKQPELRPPRKYDTNFSLKYLLSHRFSIIKSTLTDLYPSTESKTSNLYLDPHEDSHVKNFPKHFHYPKHINIYIKP